MTISFSYAYLNGLLRLIVSSDSVTKAVHLDNRAISPRMTGIPDEIVNKGIYRPTCALDALFIKTVSAISSAL